MARPDRSRAETSARIKGPPWRKHRTQLWLPITGLVVVALVLTALFTFTEFEWSDVNGALQRLPDALAIALMALLPLSGFSVAVVYLVAGAKFGPALGGVVVTGVTAVHLLGSYWISRSFLRGPLERFLARKKHAWPKVAPPAHAAVAAMTALIPGVPYFARNYLLPLSGIPLRTYFWICLPLYVARSYVTIFLGDVSGEPSVRRLLILAAVFVVQLSLCAILIARLRQRQWRVDGETAASA